MNKILSLIVPTYNMEEYLPRCLGSVTRFDVPNTLEVIVINDGSRDTSLQIAKEFESKRHDIIRIIDKENGNYGSCVNAALKIATGKYIKLLDADDWYDTDELIKLIISLSNIYCDMFITHYRQEFVSGEEKCIKISDRWTFGKEYDIDQIFATSEFMRLAMHQIGYSTKLLRDIKYKQTEGISYTDTEWTYLPLFHVEKVVFVNADVYRYYIGREGQTMSKNVIAKSQSHEAIGLMTMLNYKNMQSIPDKANLIKYLNFRPTIRAVNIYFYSLIFMPQDIFDKFDLSGFDRRLMDIDPFMYYAVVSYDKRGILIKRWRKEKKRYPLVIRKMIYIMYSIYSKIK